MQNLIPVSHQYRAYLSTFLFQSCQTVFERKDNVTTISKGCKNPTAADAMTKTCKTVPSKFFCRYVCLDNLCNEPLYPETVERKRRQSEEEPIPEGKMIEFEMLYKLR